MLGSFTDHLEPLAEKARRPKTNVAITPALLVKEMLFKK
jgi:hypothetical protein